MMKKIIACSVLAAVLSGCTFCDPSSELPPPVTVVKIQEEIKLDGKLDDNAWKKAPVHELVFIDRYNNLPEAEYKRSLQDKYDSGRAQLVYDDKYLYLGVEFDDTDVICNAKQDQGHFYRTSDVVELFLWPEDALHYWELYSTPGGFKTGFFFPSAGIPLDKYLTEEPIIPGLDTASQIQGSLNVSSDIDKGWTTEMKVPLSELNAKGVKFEPGKKWRILIARYNYSKRLWKFQNSSYPLLPQFSYHLRLYYAPVIFK